MPSAPQPQASGTGEKKLPIRVRLRDGTLLDTTATARRHREIHLKRLHAASGGFVEVMGGVRSPAGKIKWGCSDITPGPPRRRDPDEPPPPRGQYRHGGASGGEDWLDELLALADVFIGQGKEVAVAPAVRHTPGGGKPNVESTDWLWVDVDGAAGLPALQELLRRKPPHMVVESAGSGGRHAYWHLARSLRADGQVVKRLGPIERAHERLIYALGWAYDDNGVAQATVADVKCKDRSRAMRLAGTVNGKTGNHARIVCLDLALAHWDIRELVGDLPDRPDPKGGVKPRKAGRAGVHEDPYKQIAPPEYFLRLARIEVPPGGLVSCPNPNHEDEEPSCHVGGAPDEGWCCHGCDSAGAIYDLASVMTGGPTGRGLRGAAFRDAERIVKDAYPELAR